MGNVGYLLHHALKTMGNELARNGVITMKRSGLSKRSDFPNSRLPAIGSRSDGGQDYRSIAG